MFRFRKARNPFGGKKKKKQVNNISSMELTIPTNFQCPISLDLMKDPVTLCTGITYDRQSIETWLDAGHQTCPVTKQALRSREQIPNHTLRKMIQDWCVANRSYGIERIPTPRVPVTQMEVTKILEEIRIKSRRGDSDGCHELVKKIGAWGRESERNRRCIVASATAFALSEAFNTLSAASIEDNASVLESILSVILWMFPLEDEAQFYLGSPTSLKCLFWFLTIGTLAQSRNAVLVMRELASSNQRYADAMAEMDGLPDALVKIIKEPICPTTTKAALMVIYHMINSPSPSKERTVSRLVEMGLVSLLLEMLVESDTSGGEKALGVLDAILFCEEAREKAYDHALTVPVIVKKIFRVSEVATEFAVSALWTLCKNYKGDDGRITVEALMVGVFQKVLLLLQVGCGEKTKEKATDLLKMLNAYRGTNGDCIESTDFKQLKRSF